MSPQRAKMRILILELEADGADHDGGAIDQHVAHVLAPGRDELKPQLKTSRSAFENSVDWAKANLTEEKLHEIVGWRDGQNIYRITAKGREVLILELRRAELLAKAYGRRGT